MRGIAWFAALASLQTPHLVPDPNADVPPPVKGVLLVTGDPALAKRIRREMRTVPPADLPKAFPPKRFEIVDWDVDRRIVIDRTTGPLGEVEDQALLHRALLRGTGAHGTLDVANMTPEEYEAARALYGSWSLDDAGHPIKPTAFGIDTSYDVRLRSGGTERTFSVGIIDPRLKAMKDALDQRLQNGPAPGTPALPMAVRGAAPAPRDEYDFVFVGVGHSRSPEGLGIACEAIKRIDARMRREAREAAARLLDALGYRPDPSLTGALDPSALPRSLQYGLQDQLTQSWNNLGFGSKAEALEFLAQADSCTVQTNLLLRQELSPADPARMVPSVGMEYQFETLPGGYLP